jgi:tetratricopeptide (TPR) repeat protein
MLVLASKGPESRRLFVDRDDLIAEFIGRIHSTPKNDVLFVFGEGGIGKSSLIDHMEDCYARALEWPKEQFLDPWLAICDLPACELVVAFRSRSSSPLRCARINFWEKALGKDPRDAFFGLQAVRQRLDCPAPLFQSACLLYIHATGGLTKEWMAELFPGDRADFSVGLLDQPWTTATLTAMLHLAAHGASIAMPPIALAALGRGLWGFWAKIKAPKSAVEKARKKLGNAIQDLAYLKTHELLEELPRLLAQDINAVLSVNDDAPQDPHSRLVLLFDGYDRFVGGEHHLSARDRRERRRWFHDFLAHLQLGLGAMIVVTGQEPPLWSPEIPVDARPMDHFASSDALAFAAKAAVEPATCRNALVHYATVAHNRVQPLFLALLVDAYRLGNARGVPLDPEHLPENLTVQQKQKEIIERLLGAADDDLNRAIHTLSACRTFDWKSFQHLGNKLGFAPFRARFDTLTGLSFVRPAGEGSFLLHSLIRRFLGGSNAEHDVHQAWLEYYSGDGESVADAIYHQYFLDTPAAEHSWAEAFREAMRTGAHTRCSALLNVRRDLPASFVINCVDEIGAYLTDSARYGDAENELASAATYWHAQAASVITYVVLGDIFLRWADLRQVQSDYADAGEKYALSVAAYDHALELVPNAPRALINKSLALEKLATLWRHQSDYAEADAKYSEALAASDRALDFLPDQIDALNNRGTLFLDWAILRFLQSDYTGAEEKYTASTRAFDHVLDLAPNYIPSLFNRGCVLGQWANAQMRQGDHAGASEHYESAIADCDRLLELAPNRVDGLWQKGELLHYWAELGMHQNDFSGAEERYATSMAAFDRALELAPDNVLALNAQANMLASWADSRLRRGDFATAGECYGAAVMVYDRALEFAPNFLQALNNKGFALQSWPCRMPAARSRRQVTSEEEYKPSRRSKVPMPPESRAWSASAKTRSLYSAV